jgi:hypothetical protein
MLDLSVLARRHDSDSIAVVELIGLRAVKLERFFFGGLTCRLSSDHRLLGDGHRRVLL